MIFKQKGKKQADFISACFVLKRFYCFVKVCILFVKLTVRRLVALVGVEDLAHRTAYRNRIGKIFVRADSHAGECRRTCGTYLLARKSSDRRAENVGLYLKSDVRGSSAARRPNFADLARKFLHCVEVEEHFVGRALHKSLVKIDLVGFKRDADKRRL